MALIRKLSPEVIGQIAAGEVVERPASVVKELVENSIDAGAKNITVELRDGGISYLRITDNGCGIPSEQVRLAFERHATSKIASAQELFGIQTLGFRGEALASIGAVARVTLTTRTVDTSFGTRAVMEAGEMKDIRQASSPVGTTLVVENLFSNVPVRLKFLRKPAAEAASVADYMMRLILSRPDIAFRFVNQGKTVYLSPGDGKMDSAVMCIYGREAFGDLHRVEGHMNGLVLSGYVGTGELCRGNRNQQSFFVNGRYFRSQGLSKALENACTGRVMVGRFPLCVLYLDLNPMLVDVNVHPNKLEVRFQNEEAIAAALNCLVAESLNRQTIGESLSGSSREENIPETAPVPDTVTELKKDEAAGEGRSMPKTVEKPLEKAPEKLPETVPAASLRVEPVQVLREEPLAYTWTKPVPPPDLSWLHQSPEVVPEFPPVQVRAEQLQVEPLNQVGPSLRLIGILFHTYFLFEAGEKLLMMDQHAAHERILYDRYMKELEAGKGSQILLMPKVVRVSASEMLRITEWGEILSEAGFDVSPFDTDSVVVRAVPMLFGGSADPEELLREALDEWDSASRQLPLERMRKRVAQMACKHAIKGGNALNAFEAEAFLRECLRSDSVPNCPHGRPIVVEVPKTAIEKRFKRIQN